MIKVAFRDRRSFHFSTLSLKLIITAVISFENSQSLVKLYNIQYIEDIQWVIYFIQDLYKANITTESVERSEYFRKFALFTEYFFKFILFFYLSLISTCLVYPIFVYTTQNELEVIMPLYLPFINETTIVGYTIINIYHITLISIVSFGIVAIDFFLAIIIISSLIFSKIISLEMHQIHVDLEEKNKELAIKVRFRNILRMHKEMCE